jgi:hypothetical protein
MRRGIGLLILLMSCVLMGARPAHAQLEVSVLAGVNFSNIKQDR